jgi:phosphoglycolate phosphatase
MHRTLLFDLDGTLVDSVPDLAAALNRLMVARGLACFAEPEVARLVGDGVPVLVARAFALRDRAPDPDATAEFLADYTANATQQTRAYPDAEPTLRRLAADGWRLAVCTNKPQAPASALLAALGLGDLFAAIGGGDSFPARKPDPAHLLATLHAAGGVPARALMTGDHRNDIAAATGAGIPVVFAGWGYGGQEMAAGATAVSARFPDLIDLAERLVPR